MFGRQKVAALVAEFLGTGVLTLIILSLKTSGLAQLGFFVAVATGIAYITFSLVLSEISGSHFNPALTLAAWTVKKISTLTAVLYVLFQLVGAYVGYLVFAYFFGQKLHNIPGSFTGRVFTAEAVGAGLFAFAFAASIYQGFSRALSSTVAGLGLLVGTVIATTSNVSLGLLNPAVALGLKTWVWTTYVLAPVAGAVIGFNVYYRLFTNEGFAKLAALFSSTPSTKAVVVMKPVAKKKAAPKRKK